MINFSRFIAWSLGVHLIIIIMGGLLSTTKKNAFVVFGAHSRYSSHTQYKTSRIVPFTETSKRKGKGSKHGKKKGNLKPGTKKPTKQVKKTTSKPKQKKLKRSGTIKNNAAASKNKPGKQKTSSIAKERIPELDDQGSTKKRIPKKAPQQKQKQKQKLPPPPRQPEPDDNPAAEEIAEQVEAKKPAAPMVEPINELATASIDHMEQEPTGQHDVMGDEDDNGNEGGFSIDGVDDPQTVAHYQRYVQEEIDRVWRPPLGVKKGTICTVTFSVDEKGNVQACTIAKRSTVLIYDLSIMRVARELRFHSSLWGKQFKIDFCQ